MYDILDETWEDGEYMEPVNIDLTQPDGVNAVEQRAHHDALGLIEDHWDELAGVSLTQLVDELTADFMQSSISLPRGAFADPERAGREMLILRHLYHFFVERALLGQIPGKVARHMAFPPGRRASNQSPAHHRQQRSHK